MNKRRTILDSQAHGLNDETRFNRLRDLEHYCRCYINAYVMILQGNKTRRLAREKKNSWQWLLDCMHSVLIQEGVVEREEEEEEEEK